MVLEGGGPSHLQSKGNLRSNGSNYEGKAGPDTIPQSLAGKAICNKPDHVSHFLSFFLCSNICKSFWIWEKWQQQPYLKGTARIKWKQAKHEWSGVLEHRIQIIKIKKKLGVIKLVSAEYKQLCFPGNNLWFLQLRAIYISKPLTDFFF